MKKYIFYTFFFVALLSSCSSIKDNEQDDYKYRLKVLNDYLETIIKDKNQVTIIIKEKINPNEIIEMFKGDTIVDSPTNVSRYGGIDLSLYNEKDWVKMKKKYYNKNVKESFLNNSTWKENDFTKNKMILISGQQYNDYTNGKEIEGIDIFRKYLYSLSEPIYYKNKKMLMFSVSVGKILFLESDSYVVLMKKKKDKWVEIGKAYPSRVFHN